LMSVVCHSARPTLRRGQPSQARRSETQSRAGCGGAAVAENTVSRHVNGNGGLAASGGASTGCAPAVGENASSKPRSDARPMHAGREGPPIIENPTNCNSHARVPKLTSSAVPRPQSRREQARAVTASGGVGVFRVGGGGGCPSVRAASWILRLASP
jgi:hypothetical protein